MMASQSLNNSDESDPTDHAAIEQPNHGRFPHAHPDVTDTEYREINVDELSESDFEGMNDSGLTYSDHDYIGLNPNAKVPPETSQFPVMGGVTDQYLSGESTDPCAERTDNRLLPVCSSSGSVMRKPQQSGVTIFRAAKGDDLAQSGSPQHPHGKSVSFKSVTQPKKCGRPPKNESSSLAGDRLMGRAMVKAGMQSLHPFIQPHHAHFLQLQGTHALQDNSVNVRGAAPIVTPARGQKITPRGRSASGPRRDVSDDGSAPYPMVSTQQPTPTNRSISSKKMAQFRSSQLAEDAHTREMMEAAHNALAPSNATTAGMNMMMTTQSPLDDSLLLPMVHDEDEDEDDEVSHDLDERYLPVTPGKGNIYTPISSPQSIRHASISESQETDSIMFHESLRTNPDGLPVTPGGVNKTRGRSRMSISESTGSQTASPHGSIIASPSRSHVVLHSRSLLPSPQSQRQVMHGSHLIPQTVGPNISVMSGPSTMASAQMQMSSNAPIPSISSIPSLQNQRQTSMGQRHVGQSPIGTYYGGEAAITSTTYSPRRKKEKDSDEAVEAAVSMNVRKIFQAEKRLSSTSSNTLSPRNDASDDDIVGRSKDTEKRRDERKRVSSKRKEHKVQPLREGREDEEGRDWEVSCICGQTEDDGEIMVACDQCIRRWEHVDCIFPRTKKAPPGMYFCHVCKPRPTELTPELARAYQDRVKAEKESVKNMELKMKLAQRAKNKEENSRKQPSAIRNVSKSSLPKSDDLSNSSYREVETNEYTTNARRFLSVSSLSSLSSYPSTRPSNIETIKTLRNNPRARELIVEPTIFGLVSTDTISEGDYIAELNGCISLKKECMDRELSEVLDEHTFLFEKDDDKFVIDARKCGNFTKYLRKSCKPNAVLEAIMIGSELHILIKATEKVDKHDEVSIKLEDGWRKRPRPVRGCGCDVDKVKKIGNCEMDRFFSHAECVAASSRKSLPASGSTSKIAASPIRRVVTEKKKIISAKKRSDKKGKKKGTIKLPRHSRSTKGESATTDEESEEVGRGDGNEESSVDGKEEKKKITLRRGRRNTESSIEVKKLEEKKNLSSPTRSSVRVRNDSEVKTESAVAIEDDKNKKKRGESEDMKKGPRKSVSEKEKEEIKKECETRVVKKEKKPWPVMNYSLPSERNKPSREDRKLQAMFERFEKEKKSGGSTYKGRPPMMISTTTPVAPPSQGKKEKRGKGKDNGRAVDTKEEKTLWSGRGKRKSELKDEVDGRDYPSAPILTGPPKKRLATAEAKKKRDEREEEIDTPLFAPSRTQSSLSSNNSNLIDETTTMKSVNSGGKKLLHRFQQAEKERPRAEMRSGKDVTSASSIISTEKERTRAEMRSGKDVTSASSIISTPTRSKRSNKKKEKGVVGTRGNMGGMTKEVEGYRQVMRKHAIHLKNVLPITNFSIGDMVDTRAICESIDGTTGPYSPSMLPPSLPSTPSLPTISSLPSISSPIEFEKSAKKKSVSVEEYMKRKKIGETVSGGDKKDKNEKKDEEVPKKSFMPIVDTSMHLSSSLPHIGLPGLEEEVGLDELTRRVYNETPRRGGTASSSAMGKTEPTPKRQSINERLKNEFALPILRTPSSLASIPLPLISPTSSTPSSSVVGV